MEWVVSKVERKEGRVDVVFRRNDGGLVWQEYRPEFVRFHGMVKIVEIFNQQMAVRKGR